VDDRFWLIFPDGQIFVFSYFPSAKVSAWTTYEAGFDVDGAVVFDDKVYLRSGDLVKVYDGVTYDSTVAKCWLPYFDAGNPTERKQWQGWDAAVEGNWLVYAATEPTNLSAREVVVTVTETTFNKERVPFHGQCSHVSPQFESQGSGAAKISSVVLHYDGGEDE
jgi:hypothetical protein